MAILIVDDEEAVRRVLVRVLQGEHPVTEAGTVAEARHHLARTEFDLLLCDITLADESGLELVAEVADRTPETAVVMVTGIDDPTIAARAIELGVYGYLVKPFTPNEIRITVATALRRRTLEIERLSQEEQEHRLHILGERERIALDLHDIVIQRLFATGLTLQAARPRVDDDQARTRIDGAIDQLDLTIRKIRGVIFDMDAQPEESVRGVVLDLVRESTPTLGFEPSVDFVGPVDTMIDAYATNQLLATLRETLSNIVRHASAHRVDVVLAVDRDVVLTVRDDGVGVDPVGATAGGGHGLSNMTARAHRLGGTMTLSRRATGGTRMEWRIPLGATSGIAPP